MNTINKIVKDTVPPKIELDRVGYDALWLDVSDVANPTLKVKSGNEYKETNGAASVSITVTDPQTGEPVIVTGLANVLNALAEMAGQGGNIIFTPSKGEGFTPSKLTQEEQNLLVEYVERKVGLSVVFHEEANPAENTYEGYYIPSSVEYDPATRRAWYELKSWQEGYRLKVQWRPIEVDEEA